MSHSKRNTSLAFFTSYERSLLKSTWGSRSTRLSRDSFLPFGSCTLCLLPSRDPVACPKGDLFCRECALANLLAQRKEIKRLEKEMERREKELEAEEMRQDDEARKRGLEEFERVQAGLSAKGVSGNVVGRSNGKVIVEQEETSKRDEKSGTKRKFEIDEDELLRIAQEDRAKARRAIAEENAAKKQLPSFWIASETPDASLAGADLKKMKLHSLCPSSEESKPHKYALKTLTSVKFTEEKDDSSAEGVRSCPACKKALSNATKAMLAVPCGHVVCKPCANKFMTPHEKADSHDPDAEFGTVRCYVCDEDLSGKRRKGKDGFEGAQEKSKDKIKPGLVEIKSEGTGFAGGGNNMAKKQGVAFQC